MNKGSEHNFQPHNERQLGGGIKHFVGCQGGQIIETQFLNYKKLKMENFFYSDKFYSDLGELMDDLDLYEDEDVSKLPDDYSLDCKYSKLEPIVTLSAEWIGERIDEERFTEDGDEIEKIQKILSANIDFEKVNSLMPKLYYESIEKFKITKADMVEWIK